MRRSAGPTGVLAIPRRSTLSAVLLLWAGPVVAAPGSGDFDGDRFVGARDREALDGCLATAGPAPLGCIEAFDFDADGDVDAADAFVFPVRGGHLPIPLRERGGAVLQLGDVLPFSARQSCGPAGCHDIDRITGGFHSQQGRTGMGGTVVMKDDAFGDRRPWHRSRGRYGIYSQATNRQLSSKQVATESDFDVSAFAWVRDCGACHAGGGGGELDRDGQVFHDPATGTFGYQAKSRSRGDLRLDGDYADLDLASGTLRRAPWEVTGTLGPDCLLCHRRDRTLVDGVDAARARRETVLAAAERLVDGSGRPVAAFAAAATAGQGWFSVLRVTEEGVAVLQIDYRPGVDDGSLLLASDGSLTLNPTVVIAEPKDQACWGCHKDWPIVAGTTWFDTTDVHYAAFNRLNDRDPANDVPPEESRACILCHPGNLDHEIAKGNSLQLHARDERDWEGLLTCRDCHFPGGPEGLAGPLASLEVPAHGAHLRGPLSCQACHVPWSRTPAVAYLDPTVVYPVWPRMAGFGLTSRFYSADPLDPQAVDRSRWYPPLLWKTDRDGVRRLFPANRWIKVYWADWNDGGTPDDTGDDVVAPVIGWRLNQAIGGAPLPVVRDDDGDGQLEVNRPEEILAYLLALRGKDRYGRRVAERPVLVKGERLWFMDANAPGGVRSLATAGTGMAIDAPAYPWGMDHDVLPASEAWGAGDPPRCEDCHRDGEVLSPVFDRPVLVDPYGADGEPEYRPLRQLTGIDPPPLAEVVP